MTSLKIELDSKSEFKFLRWSIIPLEYKSFRDAITKQFNRRNYIWWNRETKRALGTKTKLGFINGSCSRHDASSLHLMESIHCDSMVTCWILNSLKLLKDSCTLKPPKNFGMKSLRDLVRQMVTWFTNWSVSSWTLNKIISLLLPIIHGWSIFGTNYSP